MSKTYATTAVHVSDTADPSPNLGREGGVYLYVDLHDNGRQTLMWSSPEAFVAWVDAVAEGAVEIVRMADRERRVRGLERADEARYDAEHGWGVPSDAA